MADRYSIVDHYLADYPHKPTVAARIRRLNPQLEEGMIVRGAYHKPLSWRRAKARMQRDGFCNSPFRAPWGKIVSPFLEGPATLADIEARRCAGCRRWIKTPVPVYSFAHDGRRWHLWCVP